MLAGTVMPTTAVSLAVTDHLQFYIQLKQLKLLKDILFAFICSYD